MHLGLEGKVVLVTGGTRSIGNAIVRAFLSEGAIVHFCARTPATVQTVQAELQQANLPPSAAVHGTALDVTDAAALKDWVADCAARTKAIDVVVSNVSALAIPNTAANWDASFKTDMLAPYHLISTALPHLEASSGNAVAIGSVTGRDVDFSAPSPYGAAKAAVIHYMAQLAHTLAPKGVRVNTVSPGNTYVEDGVWGGIEKGDPELYRRQLGLNPMGRMGTPEEVANAVVFLASGKASFISGVNLNVDGALCTGVQF